MTKGNGVDWGRSLLPNLPRERTNLRAPWPQRGIADTWLQDGSSCQVQPTIAAVLLIMTMLALLLFAWDDAQTSHPISNIVSHKTISQAVRQTHPVKVQWSLAPPINHNNPGNSLSTIRIFQLGRASEYPTQTSFTIQSTPQYIKSYSIGPLAKTISHVALVASTSLVVLGSGMALWLHIWFARPKVQSYVRSDTTSCWAMAAVHGSEHPSIVDKADKNQSTWDPLGLLGPSPTTSSGSSADPPPTDVDPSQVLGTDQDPGKEVANGVAGGLAEYAIERGFVPDPNSDVPNPLTESTIMEALKPGLAVPDGPMNSIIAEDTILESIRPLLEGVNAEDIVEKAEDMLVEVEDAWLPDNVDGAVAVGLAEVASGAIASMAVKENLNELSELTDNIDENNLMAGGALARLLQLKFDMFNGESNVAEVEKIPLPAVLRALKPFIQSLAALVVVLDAEVLLSEVLLTSVLETIAGALGGVASRGSAGLTKNKKIDDTALKGVSTGAFFGARGAANITAALLGVPRPIAEVAASIIGSGASVQVKQLGRQASRKSKSRKGTKNEDAPPTVVVPGPELAGDVAKWVVYDLLISSHRESLPPGPLQECGLYFALGCLAAAAGYTTRTVLERYEATRKQKQEAAAAGKGPEGFPTADAMAPDWSLRTELILLGKACLEGGILFTVYENARHMLVLVVPNTIGETRFMFKSFVHNVEGR